MNTPNLTLVELTPTTPNTDAALALIDAVAERAATVGAEIIESEVTRTGSRIFIVVQAPDPDAFATAFTQQPFPNTSEVSAPTPVRLVGADLEDLKAQRPSAGYLVEWDLPEELDMDTYLANKKRKTPLYANVPETTFLRTYVREDMAKCLCFYNAPDESAVKRAREAVSTPIDRLFALSTGTSPS
ncbi:DUF4242 domain-containing protein [Dermatophilus congolensis]|uniref:DUF4242 domain-containing protein n=1 Tax=Dermatophilus congolensis TaxID=1863 RepID=UPI001AAEDE9B|nr:DUF4242 domain-containing protein [Dermatophilus congolensis]MBO3130313.1 DUF4242 domain-containing protein [Dermatophilus congolensis]MBO3131056.1 DUF4242 domain-containing protein [Dermatophilus congolensis]MBO3134784.1 DUF4242 domain-containing protein [Dermatophilus congolensis]MBO3137020.1 DUF4242 domain-containing protein [Dermatophilus congolensis]MBO3139265.1 DUF4242 domain-containing protein [Dermatophilus congolensis]